MNPSRPAHPAALLAAGLMMLGLAGCSPKAPPRPAAPTRAEARYLAAVDPEQLWVGAAWDSMEKAALAGGAPAERQGTNLILHFAKAKDLTLTTNEEACDQDNAALCGRYYLLFDLPWLGLMVVGKDSFDPNDIWLYDRVTGRPTALTALPKFSPDGRRMLVRMSPPESRDQSQFQIWHRNGDGAALEWSQPIPQVPDKDMGFPTSAKVKITGWQDNVISLELSDGQGHAWPGKVSLNAGRWSLEQTPPPGVTVN